MTLTLTDIKNRTSQKFGDEFQILSDYHGIDFPITIKHIKCGAIWNQTAYNFLKGKGCPRCTRIKFNDLKRKSQQKFEQEVYEKYGDQYTVLGKYHTCHTPILMRHNYFYDYQKRKIICGNEFMVSNPIAFLKREGRRTTCSVCQNKRKVFDSTSKTKLDDSYFFCVYKHENRMNKKVYIGITSVPFKKRWAGGNKYRDNQYFFDSICKYGWSNFNHYILKNQEWIQVFEEENLLAKYQYSFDEACKLEKQYIAYYRNLYGADNVYNATDGGEGLGKLKYKKVCQYDFDCNFIKEYESVKQASLETGVSYGCIGLCCNSKLQSAGNFLWKYQGSEKVIQKPRKIIHRSTRILQYDLKGTYIASYPSMKDAAMKTNVSIHGIYKCCHNQQLRAGMFQWNYEDSKKKILDITKEYHETAHEKSYRKVLKYDFAGNLLQTFPSMRDVKAIYGSTASIRACCRNQCFTAKNFIWIYEDKEKEKNLSWHLKQVQNGRKKTSFRVYRFDLSGNFIPPIYNSVKEASQALNLNPAALYQCCIGTSMTCNHYIFLYENNYKIELKKRLARYHKSQETLYNRRKIYQYSKDHRFIKEFPSIKKASIEIGISSSTICEVIDKKTKTAGGFRWKSKKD